jgi:hypothetical protein
VTFVDADLWRDEQLARAGALARGAYVALASLAAGLAEPVVPTEMLPMLLLRGAELSRVLTRLTAANLVERVEGGVRVLPRRRAPRWVDSEGVTVAVPPSPPSEHAAATEPLPTDAPSNGDAAPNSSPSPPNDCTSSSDFAEAERARKAKNAKDYRERKAKERQTVTAESSPSGDASPETVTASPPNRHRVTGEASPGAPSLSLFSSDQVEAGKNLPSSLDSSRNKKKIERENARETVTASPSPSPAVTGDASPGVVKPVAPSAPVPKVTPGMKTTLALEHADSPPPWALQEVETFAITSGWRPPSTAEEWSKFVSHHVANGIAAASWHASWRKWVGNAKTFSEGRGSARASPAAPVYAQPPIVQPRRRESN